MWVTFFVERYGRVEFEGYQVQDDSPVDLPVDTTTGVLLDLVLDRASVSPEELVNRGSATVNIPVALFNQLVLGRLFGRAASHDVRSTILQSTATQQQQFSQQNVMVESLLSLLRCIRSHPIEILRPKTFDGFSDNPEGWISFSEAAEEYNGWLSDQD